MDVKDKAIAAGILNIGINLDPTTAANNAALLAGKDNVLVMSSFVFLCFFFSQW